MNQEKVFGVLLTDQAWDDLGAALEPYTSEGKIGRYIFCEELHMGCQYFVMVASCTYPDGSSFKAEIGIHHHYLKMYISANKRSEIGFVQS